MNPNGTGNTAPLHQIRSVAVEIYDVNNTFVLTAPGSVTYNGGTGKFTGTAGVDQLPPGYYTARIKISQYLRKAIPGILTVQTGQTTAIPLLSLSTGDTNDDNVLSILDYNLLLDCFSELTPPKNCADPVKKQMTDLTDDGNVNQFDYNLFLRELSVQTGQ